MERTSSQLYRDLLRMIRHASGTNSPKTRELRVIVKQEFIRNSQVKDEQKVEELKSNAIRALSNYLLMQSASKDGRFSN